MIFYQELLISDTIFEQELLISDIEFDQELLISPTACDQAPFCCLCCREHERSLIVCRASPGMATVLNQEPRVLIIQLSLLLAESFVLRIATSFQSSPRRIGFKYSQRPCSQWQLHRLLFGITTQVIFLPASTSLTLSSLTNIYHVSLAQCLDCRAESGEERPHRDVDFYDHLLATENLRYKLYLCSVSLRSLSAMRNARITHPWSCVLLPCNFPYI